MHLQFTFCRLTLFFHIACQFSFRFLNCRCEFPIKGSTYMQFPNKCNKPFECTKCPGNLVIVSIVAQEYSGTFPSTFDPKIHHYKCSIIMILIVTIWLWTNFVSLSFLYRNKPYQRYWNLWLHWVDYTYSKTFCILSSTL